MDTWTRVMARDYPVVCRTIARRIPGWLRAALDPEDIVMEGLLSLYRGDPARVPDAALLTTAAVRRLGEHARIASGARRDGRCVRVDLVAPRADDRGGREPDDPFAAIADRAATAESAAVARETLGRLVEGRDRRQAIALLLLAQGYRTGDVARVLGVSMPVAKRIVRHVRDVGLPGGAG